MTNNIKDKAKRCLQCSNPRCSKGCPVNTSIKQMISMLLNDDIMNAGKMLFDNNPLSVICSLVCPHEKQCEGHCVLGIKGTPVNISAIENYISDYYLDSLKPTCKKDSNKKVAIIGSGPAGITITFVLASRGYDITIFEAHDKIGGVMMYGIPEFRLPKSILSRIKTKLLEMGVKIRPNTLIGPVLSVDDLFRDGYKAIFIGTGVWKPRALGIKGESLGHVNFAIDYLKNPNAYELGDKLCIIGAGNVAMDVARTALRNGVKDVHIMYRGSMNSISAEKHEVECVKAEGGQFELFKMPIEITDEGVTYIDTATSLDENGNESYEPINDSQKLFKADSIIVAISQGPRANIVSTTNGIEVGPNGLVSTDPSGKTTREGVFASGDVVTGAKTVVEAVRLSKNVADAIDEYVLKSINEA